MTQQRHPVIALSTSKGGAGKTTMSIALAAVFADWGYKIAMIDTDPQQSLMDWAQKPGKPDLIDVFSAEDEDALIDLIEACKKSHQMTLIDVQGRVSELGNTAMAWADLVLIPVQASAFDAAGASNTIATIRRVERARRTEIPFSTVLNRVPAAIASRTLLSVREAFDESGIEILTSLVDREAYRVMTAAGGTIYTLDKSQAPGLDKAKLECETLAIAVSAKLGLIDPADIEQEMA